MDGPACNLWSSCYQGYKRALDSSRGAPNSLTSLFQQPHRRFQVLLHQRHIKLLARSVDLSYIISQHINERLVADLELVIKVSIQLDRWTD